MLNSPIDKIKERLDVVDVIQGYLKLKKRGANYVAKCPFHSEQNPSFYVSPEKQIWHCFGCSRGGDIFGFVKEIEGVEFREALRILAKQAGVQLKKVSPELQNKKEKLFNICEQAAQFFEENLKHNKKARDYLKKRGLKQSTIKKFRLGYAPGSWRRLKKHLLHLGHKEEDLIDAGLLVKPSEQSKARTSYDRFRGRIIFPIFNLAGQPVGFSGRMVKQDNKGAKYINTSNTLIYDKSKVLYGLDKAKMAIRRLEHAILTEGNLDVVMSHQAGVKNAIATSGSSLTSSHLNIIKRYTPNVKIAFDADKAGKVATRRGFKQALKLGMNVKIITFAKGKDPADLVKLDPQQWIDACKNAQNFVQYFFEQTLKKYPQRDVDSKKKIAAEVLPIIKVIQNKVEQAHWLQELAGELNVDESYLSEALAKTKTIKGKPENHQQHKDTKQTSPPSRLQLLEQELLALFAAYPEKLKAEIKKLTPQFFNTKKFSQIFKLIKKHGNKALTHYPKELENPIKLLQFRAEFMNFKCDEDICKEAKLIISQIRKIKLESRLRAVCKQIQECEQESAGEKLNKALKQYSQITEKLAQLQ